MVASDGLWGNSTYNGLVFAYPAYWARDWATAGYDRTQNFELWSIYELPFGKSHAMLQHGIAAAIFGGWQVNAVFTAASGTPFTVTSNAALNGPGNREVAEQVLPSVEILGGIGSGQSWFNPKAYANPAQNTFGNSGRDSLRGPGFFELDASLFRDLARLKSSNCSNAPSRLQLPIHRFSRTPTRMSPPLPTSVRLRRLV